MEKAFLEFVKRDTMYVFENFTRNGHEDAAKKLEQLVDNVVKNPKSCLALLEI